MDVITIESKAYHELMGKIEKILRYVEKEEKAKIEYENRLVTNDELAEILGISKRTLQRMRSTDRISYKMIYGRCYYDLHDIEKAIRNKSHAKIVFNLVFSYGLDSNFLFSNIA